MINDVIEREWGSYGSFTYTPQSLDTYRDECFVVFQHCVKPHVLKKWNFAASALLAAQGKRVYKEVKVPKERIGLDEGYGRRYWIVDGLQLIEAIPEFWLSYAFLPEALSPIVNESLICSPYTRSGVSLKAYLGADYHGAHRDTNPVTALLYLTDGAPTVIHKKNGNVFKSVSQAGTMIVFKGRELLHNVAAQHQSARHVLAFNLYTTSDIWRPAGTDDLVYGN